MPEQELTDEQRNTFSNIVFMLHKGRSVLQSLIYIDALFPPEQRFARMAGLSELTQVGKVSLQNVERVRTRMRGCVRLIDQYEKHLASKLPPEEFKGIKPLFSAARIPLQSFAERGVERLSIYETLNLGRVLKSLASNFDGTRDDHGRKVSVTLTPVPENTRIVTRAHEFYSTLSELFLDAVVHPKSDAVNLRVSVKPLPDARVRLRFTSLGAEPLDPETARKIGHETFTTRKPRGDEVHGYGKIMVNNYVTNLGGSFRAFNERVGKTRCPALEIILPQFPLPRGQLKLKHEATARLR